MNKAINSSISLLTRDESNFIKGVLILLIIIGHNSVLMNALCSGNGIKDYLYAFHIHSFFYLPVLYNIPQFSLERVKKDFYHLFTPYTILFVILTVISYLFLDNRNNFTNIVWAYFSGAPNELGRVTGMQFLWFLPSMFVFLILRNVYFNFKRYRIPLLIISFSVLLLLASGSFNVIDFAKYTPLGVFYAISNFFLAIFLRWLIENNNKSLGFKIFFPIAFFVISILYFLIEFNKYSYYPYIYVVIPLVAFPTIFLLAKTKLSSNVKFNFMIYLGKISLPVYLFHQIVYNVLMILFSYVNIINESLLGVVILIATLLISIAITITLKYLFPKIYTLFS